MRPDYIKWNKKRNLFLFLRKKKLARAVKGNGIYSQNGKKNPWYFRYQTKKEPEIF